MERWLRTSKIPIFIAAVVLVAILVAMYFRLTDPTAGAAPLPSATSLRLPHLGTVSSFAQTDLGPRTIVI